MRSATPSRRVFPACCTVIGLLACLAGGLPAGTAMAASATAPSHDGLPAYEHSAWMAGHGAPGDIWDMAQDREGHLWLATGSGLYRFDGRHFDRQPAPPGSQFPSSNMTTLTLDDDGTLWIGYFNAGLSRLDRTGLHTYQAAQGLPDGMIPRIARDGSGRLWAASDGGLRWFDGQRWQAPPAAMGLPAGSAHWLERDPAGTLWLVSAGELWHLPAHGQRFLRTGIATSRYASLAVSPQGEVWLADRSAGLMPVATPAGVVPEQVRAARRWPGLFAGRIRFSHDGALWGSMIATGGIFRLGLDVPGVPVLERFDRAQGLTSTTAVPLLEDREHNVWAGTNLGLNRFRVRSVRALEQPLAADALRVLYQAPDGQVYAYGEDQQPIALRRELIGAPHAAMAQAARDSDAPIWLDHWNSLGISRRGIHTPLAPPGLAAPRNLRAMAHAGTDEAWFCFDTTAVRHFLRGQWTAAPDLPAQACSAAAMDPAHGRVLLGYPDGSLRIRRDGRWHLQGARQGLAVGPITAIFARGEELLVAGETGLALRGPDGRFHPVRADVPGVLEGITGIVADAEGARWFNGSRGLLRIDAAELTTATLAQASISPRLFDSADGMPGIALQASPLPSAALGPDGVLWLATNQGLAWLDTRRVLHNALPPLPSIGAVTVGERQLPLDEGLALPPGTTQLQIDYAATTLARPERTRYRHRLLGLDPQWQEAGALTRAFYTNLPPGSYRFEVMAANEDNVWSEHAAHRQFRIMPSWWQTGLFKIACVLLVLAALALAVRYRSRQLSALVRARLHERHAERERIARELHDTLLQGSQGLILRLHAVSQAPHTPAVVREALEDAMQHAEHALAEGRERVRLLREGTPHQDLVSALVQVYSENAHDSSAPALRVNVEGTPLPLREDAAEEVLLIGREAVLNALRHARAGALEIEVIYSRRSLRLHVRDDGIGLPSAVAEGHWGLIGMRERAERLGGRLRLWTRPQLGTEIELHLSAERIYLHPRRRWPWPRTPKATR